MASAEVIEKLATRATAAEQMIEILIKQIEEIKTKQVKGNDYAQEIKTLRAENSQLKGEIQSAKKKLIEAEKDAGIVQVDFKPDTTKAEPPKVAENLKENSPAPTKKEKPKKEKVKLAFVVQRFNARWPSNFLGLVILSI